MLAEEAEWIGSAVAELPEARFPLLNVGSQTDTFRTVAQPWIDEKIFAPLRSRGLEVVHVDLQSAPGVDLVLDVMEPDARGRLREVGAGIVLCSNLLEHVSDPWDMLDALVDVTPPGGFLVLTGPQRYPYHPDPIDNGFRPDWQEVAHRVVDSAVVVRATRIVGPRFVDRYLAAARRRVRRGSPATVTGAADAVPGRGLRWAASRLWWIWQRPSAYALVLRRR